MSYEPSGELTTDERQVGTSTEWDTQSEWEAYQSLNNLQIENGVVKLASAIPDSVVVRLLMDEGSGTTLNDAEGNHDGMLNQDSWTTGDSTFRGDAAPFFDQVDDYGYLDHGNPAELSVVIRVHVADDLSPGLADKFVWSHQFSPGVSYNKSDEQWQFYDSEYSDQVAIQEAQSTIEGSTRILAYRRGGGDFSANVYDNSGTEIGNASAGSPSTTYQASRMYLGWGNDGDRYWGDNLDMLVLADEHLSDQDLDTVLQEEYL